MIKEFDLEREYPIKCKAFLPDGPVRMTVLGVHGFAGDKESSMLSELAKAIEPMGGALICFDFPAHGDSETDERYLTVENCMADILTVANWMEQTYAAAEKYVFATSFGGYISLLSADSLPGYKMILRAPAVTMPKVLLQAVLQVSPEEFKTMGTVTCGFERKIKLPYSFYENLTDYDPREKMYDKPILVIHGDQDDVVPVEDVKAFCRGKENVELIILENADHRFKKKGEMERILRETIQFMGRTI